MHLARYSLYVLLLSAGCIALTGCSEDEFTNSGTLLTSVTTNDPFEFPVGRFFIDARNGNGFDAYVVTRAVEADGSPGAVLATNQYLLGNDEEFTVHLEAPMRGPNQTVRVGVYLGNGDPDGWKLATADGKALETTLDVSFVSSVVNTASPYYHLSCGISGARAALRREHRTALDYDCRCGLPSVSAITGLTYNWDMEVLDTWSTMCSGIAHEGNDFKLGEGPQLKTIRGRMTAGDIWADRDEIIFGVKWGSLSAAVDPRFTIMAIDYNTGERRVVSGEFVDPMLGEYTVGDGPLGMPFVGHVRRGPDGQIYAITANHRILRVDPETGDRTLLWAHGDDTESPQCDNGVRPEGHPDWRQGDGQPGIIQFSIEGRGFTVGPDGAFYIPTLANGSPRPGYGIVRVAADGSSCEHVSRAPGDARNAYADGTGSGFAFESGLDTMIWHEGKLIAVSVGADTYQIDPQTGDRVRLAGQGLTGTPNLPRVNRMFWDATREVFVLSGILPPNGTNFLTWNPDTHDTYAYFCAGPEEDNELAVECAVEPMATLPTAALPAYVLPNGLYLSGFAAGGFLLYEMKTGNNHWFAY
jgi:hypothetical protein